MNQAPRKKNYRMQKKGKIKKRVNIDKQEKKKVLRTSKAIFWKNLVKYTNL